MDSVMNGATELFKNLCPKPQCVNCNHLQMQFSNGSCLLMCNIDNKECPHWTEKEQKQ